MSDDDEQVFQGVKHDIIVQILNEEDLYKIIGAPRTASASDLRRSYLDRSKIIHPDKPPFHPLSTSAFQRLGFALDILKSPSARRTYDRAARPSTEALPEKTTFLGGEHTFRTAVEAILTEFMTGDFVHTHQYLELAHQKWPNLVSKEVVVNIESSFVRIRELVLTTRTYALLIYIELGRIRRVQKQLMGLGYLDVRQRARLTIHLVRVTLAVPMRVDKALRNREEKAWRAKVAGLQAAGLPAPDTRAKAGILNERISKVIEYLVGSAGKDEDADEAWASNMGETT